MSAQLLIEMTTHGRESLLEGFLYILGCRFLVWEVESPPSLAQYQYGHLAPPMDVLSKRGL